MSAVKPDLRLSMGREAIVPERTTIEVKPESIWKPDALAALSLRTASIPEGADAEVAVPRQSLRASDAILRWAEGTKSQLVAYVSTMTDATMLPGDSVSLRDVLNHANQGQLDKDATLISVSERVNPPTSSDMKPTLAKVPRYSMEKVQGVFVVRNEWRFLDSGCGGPSGISSAALNAVLHHSEPSLKEVASSIAKLNFAGWSNGLFADRDLQFCNPISFRPIALAYLSSPNLRKALAEIKERQPVTLTMSDLGEAGATRLTEALGDSAPLNDSNSGLTVDPMFAPVEWSSKPADQRTLRVFLNRNTYSFLLRAGETIVWSSWVKGVKVGE